MTEEQITQGAKVLEKRKEAERVIEVFENMHVKKEEKDFIIEYFTRMNNVPMKKELSEVMYKEALIYLKSKVSALSERLKEI